MSLLDEALSRVTSPRRDGEWFSALCPVHEADGNGHHASLRLRAAAQVEDGVIVTCMAGCPRESLQAALGLGRARGKSSSTDENTHLFWVAADGQRRIVATYDYTDEAGSLLFQKVRYSPKFFAQRRPFEGAWVWGLTEGTYAQGADGDWHKAESGRRFPDTPRVLYRLPELVNATECFCCEGEKAADALRSLGLTATCASGGAGKWRADYARSLAGKTVYVVPDNDEQGRHHAEIVIAALRRAGVTCALVKLPDLPEKGDAYDAVQAGLDAEEIMGLAEDALTRREAAETAELYREHAVEYRLTEGGNAERFAAEHAERVAFVPERGQLLVYRRGVFVPDTTELDRLAKRTVLGIYEEAAGAPSERRRILAEHARRSDTRRARESMVALARSEESLETSLECFDADPWQLCVRNGVVDLRTGELAPHAPHNRMTRMTKAAYDPGAACPLWRSHLDRIFGGDRQMTEFLQMLLGYGITGLSCEQVFAIFYGEGANGKGVTMHVVERILGTMEDGGYAATADSTTFSKRSSDAIRNDLARLSGARLVSTSERRARRTLDEELVKRLTGGDRITARFLHHESFEFEPQFLIIMATNHKPTVDVADYAIKRRVLLVPFEVTIPEPERDRFLDRKLAAEGDAILAWLVEGAALYACAGGLVVPDRVRAATDAYRETMDPLAGFAEYVTTDPDAWTPTADIRRAVERWAKEEGVEPPSGKDLGSWLTRQGATDERRRVHGSVARGWRGIVVEGCQSEHTLGV